MNNDDDDSLLYVDDDDDWDDDDSEDWQKKEAEKIYNVDSQSKYGISITEIENIEDAGEHFINRSELDELGIGYIYSHNNVHTFDKKIKAALAILKRKIAKSGKKSCKIEDDELVDILKESQQSVSSFGIEGLRRVGNRLSLAPTKAAKTEAKKQDFNDLVSVCFSMLEDQLKTKEDKDGYSEYVRIDIKYTYHNRAGVITMLKKLFTWEEIVKRCDDDDDDQLKWWKMLWDDVSILEPKIVDPITK